MHMEKSVKRLQTIEVGSETVDFGTKSPKMLGR